MNEKIEDISEELSEVQIKKIDEFIEAKGNKKGGIIPLLEGIQDYLGYVPLCVQKRIAEKTGIPDTRIYGVVTFYSFFSMNKKARHRLQVCAGTACYVKGGKEIAEKIEKEYNINVGESTEDGRFTYEKARCFGTCGLAPVVMVDGKVYGKVTVDTIDDILEQYQ